MTSAKFKLVKSVDCCIDSFSFLKTLCPKVFRAIFKDSRQRPQIFSFVNLGLCTICVIAFCFYNFGIKKHTTSKYWWVFAISVIVSWIMGLFLIYSYIKRKHILCKVWCIAETGAIFTWLYLTLSESMHMTSPGLTLLGSSMVFNLYGLGVIYYLSLELEYSPESRYDDEEDIDEDRFKAKYIAKRSFMTRRDTDQTSIASPPPSPGNFDDDQLDECGDSVLDDNSPTAASILFFHDENIFNREPQDRPFSIESTASKDNIIISDLMCGGNSSLNAELQA